MISFDEMGPISLRPQQGAGWARPGRPERLRATYNRRQGVRYLISALDVHGDRLRARLRPGRNGASTLAFIRTIRLAYPPGRRIYWIQDGLSSHWTPAIRAWAATNNVELVPTPTYASYLNRIECHFGPINEFVCGPSRVPRRLFWLVSSFQLIVRCSDPSVLSGPPRIRLGGCLRVRCGGARC